jgi:hypothetical protein
MKGAYMVAATEQSTMIAVFADREQANRAIDVLRQANYGYDQIRLVQRGSNSFIEDLKGLFNQTSATTNSADDWMRIGIPEQDARNYQSEIDAGRSIVLIKALNNPEQALGMMRQSGAYDIVVRLRMAQPAMAGVSNNAQAAQAGTYNANPQAPVYNPNAAQATYNPNAPAGPYDTQPQPNPNTTPDGRDV